MSAFILSVVKTMIKITDKALAGRLTLSIEIMDKSTFFSSNRGSRKFMANLSVYTRRGKGGWLAPILRSRIDLPG